MRPHHIPGGGRGGPPDVAGPTEVGAIMDKIDFDAPTPELFDQTAERIAGCLRVSRNANKSAQLRRFYDEIVRYSMLHPPAASDGEEARAGFARTLPFIRMIAAQAAYARSRGNVDQAFVDLMQRGLRKVQTPEHLALFRTLFEAVIGFKGKD